MLSGSGAMIYYLLEYFCTLINLKAAAFQSHICPDLLEEW